MTLNDFKTELVAADPTAKRYKNALRPNYTVWHEYDTNNLRGDDRIVDSIPKVQIDRFTKIEDDPIVAAITEMLNDNDIAFSGPLTVAETESGYIHHIWTCEVD